MPTRTAVKIGTLCCAMALSLSACAGNQTADGRNPNRGTTIGAGAGAVAGGVLGAILDKKDKRGVPVGAIGGAAIGAGIGSIFDRQQREFEQVLASERQANEIEVERVRDDLLKLTLDSEVSFDLDSAALRPEFRDSLAKLADVLRKYDQNEALVVGYTDSTGPDAYNQRLSERRAQSVADALANYGVPRSRLATEGRGEREPRASNADAAGRQLNRRVEIYVSPDNA